MDDTVKKGDDVDGSLSSAVSKGVAWSGSAGVLVRLFRFAVFVVLARLVAPQDFGVVAVAAAVIGILVVVTTAGIGPALIQRRELGRTYVDSAFWFAACAGVLVTGLLVAAAPIVADVLSAPDLTNVLRVVALVLLINALATVPQSLMVRRLQMRQLGVRSVVAALLSSVAGLGFALAGAGVWALVVQTVSEAAVSCFLVWLTAHYRPRASVSLRSLRELLAWGTKTSGMDVLTAISQKVDDLIIGALLGVQALGIYSVAYRLVSQLNEVVSGTTRNVSLSAFSRMQDDEERLSTSVLRVFKLLMVVLLGIYGIMAVAAPAIIDLAFGVEWARAVPVLSALCLLGVLLPIIDLTNNALQAVGLPGRALRITLLRAVLVTVGFLVAVRAGLVWVAVTGAFASMTVIPFSMIELRRAIGLRASVLARTLIKPVMCLAVVLGALLSVRLNVGCNAVLILASAIAGVAYAAVLFAVDKHLRWELISISRRFARRAN